MNNAHRKYDPTGTNHPPALRVLIGGMLGMMVAMGIGRFAFTPILPLMQRDLGISHSLAGWLASLNYVGYLAGALLCAARPRLLQNKGVNVSALAGSIATTLLMGLTVSPLWWGVLRLLGGVASALLFVIIAIEVSEVLASSRHSRWNSALFSGVGLGIALSGALVPLMDRLGGWSVSWLGMGAVAVVLAVTGIGLAGKRHGEVQVPNNGTAHGTGSLKCISRLATAYFLEGVGYIVSATFLVTMIAHTPGLSGFAPWSWVAVGLAAVPSTVFWQWVAGRIGIRFTLTLTYLLQAFGIFLSIGAATAFTAGLAAVIFGGTFMGIVALAMAEGAQRAGKEGRRAAAVMTACFGAGQVVGPLLAGVLADYLGGFSVALIMAGTLVTIGGILVATDTISHISTQVEPQPSKRRHDMPYVNIKITREGATTEQKAALIRGATQLLVDVLGKNPATTVVVIDEVDTDNWGIGGETVTLRRKAGK